MEKYRFSFEKQTLEGIETVAFFCEGGGHKMGCFISPKYGANLVRFTVDGKNVIDFDPALLKAHDYTGTPVLYPTPNRVRGGKFAFEGRVFSYECRGRPPYEHGLVHYEKWDCPEPEIWAGGISAAFRLECEKGGRMHEAFPITHSLTLKYTLSPEGVKIEYSINNRDGRPLPYGFALHPYFMKLAGDEGTYAKLPAGKYMQATKELLPTGKLLPVSELDADIAGDDSLGSMDFDHVFTELVPGGCSEIWYDGIPFKVKLEAGPTFSHLVFYTPPGEDFFCIENQTCSTDAHNMYERGFVKESGLEIIAPYGKNEDFVFYRVEFCR